VGVEASAKISIVGTVAAAPGQDGARPGMSMIRASDLLWWAAVEPIMTLLTTGERTTLLLELVHAHSGEGGGSMVLGSVVMNLMDWNSRMDDVRLDSLLLNDRLNGLVHMVVHMLAGDRWLGGASTGTLNVVSLITVPRLLGRKLALNLIGVIMLVRPVLGWHNVVVVLLRENLRVLHRLFGSVVVVLVDLLVDGGCLSLMLFLLDCLLLHSRCNLLVDSGLVVTRARHELLDRILSGFHFDL